MALLFRKIGVSLMVSILRGNDTNGLFISDLEEGSQHANRQMAKTRRLHSKPPGRGLMSEMEAFRQVQKSVFFFSLPDEPCCQHP
jgi:hypothetical protein